MLTSSFDLGEHFDTTGGTFMGIGRPGDVESHKIAIFGVPLDMGTRPSRVGSREGPDAIRVASRMLGMRFDHLVERPGPTPFDPPLVADWGNVRMNLGRVEISYQAVEEALNPIVDSGLLAVGMGGDGAVTLPQLRAAGEMYADIAVVHLDAHTDAVAGVKDLPYTNATTFMRAQEEGVVNGADVVHVGVRGTCPVPGTVEIARDLGQQVVTGEELRLRGLDAVVSEIIARFRGRSVYLCWDMDVFDPSAAPGVVTPEWGGISAAEGIALIRGLAPLDLKWCDFNTVSPPHDIQLQTSSLAARMVLEALYIMLNRMDR